MIFFQRCCRNTLSATSTKTLFKKNLGAGSGLLGMGVGRCFSTIRVFRALFVKEKCERDFSTSREGVIQKFWLFRQKAVRCGGGGGKKRGGLFVFFGGSIS